MKFSNDYIRNMTILGQDKNILYAVNVDRIRSTVAHHQSDQKVGLTVVYVLLKMKYF